MVERTAFNDVSSLLTHEGSALLIDKIESCGVSDLSATVLHDRNTLYSDDQGNVPTWVGLEYMAQAISAFAGIKSLQENEPIRIGLLLGVRQYKIFTSQFKKNSPVIIEVEEIFRDETNFAMFDCEIKSSGDGCLLATAQVKAIWSANIDELLGEI